METSRKLAKYDRLYDQIKQYIQTTEDIWARLATMQALGIGGFIILAVIIFFIIGHAAGFFGGSGSLFSGQECTCWLTGI